MGYRSKAYDHQQENDYKDYDDATFSDFDIEEDFEELNHRKKVRRLLEERLDRRRLKRELDDFDGELEADFDWEDIQGK